MEVEQTSLVKLFLANFCPPGTSVNLLAGSGTRSIASFPRMLAPHRTGVPPTPNRTRTHILFLHQTHEEPTWPPTETSHTTSLPPCLPFHLSVVQALKECQEMFARKAELLKTARAPNGHDRAPTEGPPHDRPRSTGLKTPQPPKAPNAHGEAVFSEAC